MNMWNLILICALITLHAVNSFPLTDEAKGPDLTGRKLLQAMQFISPKIIDYEKVINDPHADPKILEEMRQYVLRTRIMTEEALDRLLAASKGRQDNKRPPNDIAKYCCPMF